MRHFATLFAILVAFLSFADGRTTQAQDGSQANEDSVTFVIELDDRWIEALKRGEPLESKIPPALRNKVTEVRIRYKKPQKTAGARNGINQLQPSQNRFSTGDQRSSMNSVLPDRRLMGGTSVLSNIPRAVPGNQQYGPPAPSSSTFAQNRGIQNSRQNDGRFGQSSEFGRQPQNTSLGNPNFGAPQNDMRPINPNPATGIQNGWTPPGDNTPRGPQFQPQRPSNTSTSPAGNFLPRNNPTDTSRLAVPSDSQFDTSYDPQRNYTNPNNNYRMRAETPNNQNQNRGLIPSSNPQYNNPPQNPGPNLSRYAQVPPSINQSTNSQQLVPGYNPTAYPGIQPQPVQNSVGPRFQPNQRSLVAGHDTPSIDSYAPEVTTGYRMARNDGNFNQAVTRVPPASINGDPQIESNRLDKSSQKQPLASIDRANRFNGVLWFMLLCSVGLNFYLAWISRGFYVRYRELADELRETFASTI